MSIKLLALDLDGTIVTNLHTISERTQAAIKAAVRQGVQVVIATGREYPVTQKFIRLLELTTPVICYQGALIYDFQTDRVIASQTLPLPLAQQLIDLGRAHRLALHLYIGHQAYTEAPTDLSRSLLTRTGIYPHEVSDLKQVTTSAHYKGLIVHPAAYAGSIAVRLAEALDGKLSVFRSFDTLIEVTSPQVSKGQALATLAGYYGLAQDEVMAIGDQDNDIDMIAWAGVGVAMGNASPGAKAAANHIAPPIEAEGAAWAIETFILEQALAE